MNITAFEQLLKQTMGLDAASIGSAAIERAVQKRLSICRLPDTQAYWERVCSSEIELQELVEAVVVPETWFFRDPLAFSALGQLIRDDWLTRHRHGSLRLLSLPCSSGEEPFSMAMTLLDAGIPAHRFAIDAIDISACGLAQARRAVYGKNSFRGSELAFHDRYFEHTAQGDQLAEAVREQVQFQQGNLIAADLLPGVELYDVIFCRNVLIYFDGPTQNRVIQVLARLLKEQGLLFVGPSETGVLLNHGFVSTKLPLAFAFRKATAVAPETARDTTPGTVHPAPQTRPVSAQPLGRIPAKPAATPKANAPPHLAPGIDDAERLADQGRLAEAGKCCEAHLRAHGPSAKAFYLLGLIRDASGTLEEAADSYRKALYLEPTSRSPGSPRLPAAQARRRGWREGIAAARGPTAEQEQDAICTRRLTPRPRCPPASWIAGTASACKAMDRARNWNSTFTAATAPSTPRPQWPCSTARPRLATSPTGPTITHRSRRRSRSTCCRYSSFASVSNGWPCRRRHSPKSPSCARFTRCPTGAAAWCWA
ncbi:CheR family methyltransferase [Roseateles sp.]|uniref:CheR family methyltransferase n=1 Tax=Roseateles sp. TaxID=1971397 RepID=UPI0032630E0C